MAAAKSDRQYFQQLRSEMIPFIPLGRQRVLEIGCGDGLFLSSLPDVDERWGIEPDSTAATQATDRLSRVLCGRFDDVVADLPENYFDIIVCNDVIEHMSDHDQFFDKVKNFIRPSGVLVGSVPNVRYYRNLMELLLLRDWHYRSNGVLDKTHLRFFTRRSLRHSLVVHGYKIDRLELINRSTPWSWTKWDMLYFASGYLLIALSLGWFRDIRYVQIAFRASPA